MEETHFQEEGVVEISPRKEKSDTETECVGEAGTSQPRRYSQNTRRGTCQTQMRRLLCTF